MVGVLVTALLFVTIVLMAVLIRRTDVLIDNQRHIRALQENVSRLQAESLQSQAHIVRLRGFVELVPRIVTLLENVLRSPIGGRSEAETEQMLREVFETAQEALDDHGILVESVPPPLRRSALQRILDDDAFKEEKKQ